MDEDRGPQADDEQRVVVIRTAPASDGTSAGGDDRDVRRLGRVEAHARHTRPRTTGRTGPGIVVRLALLLALALAAWGALVIGGVV